VVISIDFDDTIVSQAGRAYDDVTTPLRFMPGAREALVSLKRAGHTLVLFSGRANRALREDPMLDPLIRAGKKRFDRARWERGREVNEARYQQMLAFVEAQLPGVFAAVDDGLQGKPSADLIIDDKAVRLGHGVIGLGWRQIAQMHGEPVYGQEGR
jgi:hypothetical protein